MYSETLLEHFQSPHNTGEMEEPDGEAADENPVCGDRLHIWLRIVNGTIAEMRWQAEGCAPAIAAASVVSEIVRGMPWAEARAIDRVQVADALGGLPPRKAHAAVLVVRTLRKAIDSYDTSRAAPHP